VRQENPFMTFRTLTPIGVALLFVAALPACNHSKKSVAKPPVPVKVEVVENSARGTKTRYSGSLEPAVKLDMAFRVGGYVEALGEVTTPTGKRAIDKGDFVKKGTVLARVRAADYAQKVATANAQVSEARASAKLASEELERAKKLFDMKAISKAELDSALARADSAQAQVAGAIAQSGEAGISLGDTVLRAPMDGVLLSRQVEVGSLVSPGQPAITLADTRTVKAIFGAPQALVEKLRVGSSVRVFVGGEAEAKAAENVRDASITRIAPAADANGRVFSIEATLPNEDGVLRPGSVTSVHVPEVAVASATLSVPLSAVLRSPRDARGFSVFVLEGKGDRGPTRLYDVGLGEVIGNAVTVTRGLTQNQRVVTVGAALLRDGSDAVVIR
jgi:RND family efflux transporter MFP subunit